MKKERKIFLDKLPRWKKGESHVPEGRINWIKCIGRKVQFIYDDIEGELEIINYENNFLLVKYLDNNIHKVCTGGFSKCRIAKIIGKVTSKFKIEIGTRFQDEKRDITILDREYRPIKNTNLKWYKYHCNKCGWSEGWMKESHIFDGIGCSCCANSKTLIEGINDIPTTASWMVKYFQGGYEEAKLYTKTSGQKIYPICPDCGRVKDKPMIINTIYNQHSIGCTCSDGVSYPEKFMTSILNQLNMNFITQLSKSNLKWCDKYRYDFYFEYDNQSFIVETHGMQHYNAKGISEKFGKSLEQVQENDKQKEQLAKKNKISHYIIIDCRYSELEWIKSSVLNSKLNDIFDLNDIDWVKCEEKTMTNLIKLVCEIKKNSCNIKNKEISKITKLEASTVSKYIKKGNKLGWC